MIFGCGGTDAEVPAGPAPIEVDQVLLFEYQSAARPAPLRNAQGEVVAMQLEIMLSDRPFDCTRSVADLVPAGVRLVEFHRPAGASFSGEYGAHEMTTIALGQDLGGSLVAADGDVSGYVDLQTEGGRVTVPIEAASCGGAPQ